MYTYHRTSSHSTNIQRILRGSLTNKWSRDLILIKEHSLEWLTVHPLTDNDTNLLKSRCQQPSLGTIIDARLLTCHFEEEEEDDDNDDQPENITGSSDTETLHASKPYAKYIRNHSRINGNEVIVALSEYGKLVFITVVHHEELERPRFETLSQIYLDTPGLEYDKRGRKLAVDPSGRAIAVASFEDTFDIFILGKRVSRKQFDPVIGRGAESEKGIIWHMDFLYTEETSMNRILLVLVVYNDVESVCRLVLYAIDASNTDNIIVEKISRLPLEKNTPSPVLLIPLNFQPESFLLITEQEACLLTADDLSCGNVLYPTRMIPRAFGEFECALFTAFALYPESSENYLYLGAVDGSFYKVEIESSGEMYWHRIEDVNPIGQSLCVVGRMKIAAGQNNDEFDADILLCAGESADNELIAVYNTSYEPDLYKHITLQTLDNFAPLTDMNVVRNNGQEDTLILCSGQDAHGSLRMLTHGVEAVKLHSSKADWKGVHRLWTSFSNTSMSLLEKEYILMSSLIDTRLLAVKSDHIVDITAESDIDFGTTTTYAAFMSLNEHDVLLQVNTSGWSLRDLCCVDTGLIQSIEGHILSATSWQTDDTIYISLCVENQNTFSLNIVKVSDVDRFGANTSLKVDESLSTSISTCPSCIEQFQVSTHRLLAIGTFEPSLIIFSIDKHIQQIQRIDLEEYPSNKFSVPSSIAILEMPSDTSIVLLAGLRQGSILSFRPVPSYEETATIQFMQHSKHNIGTRSVHLIPSLNNSSSIYVLSDDLWKLSCSVEERLSMNRVLLPKFDGAVDAFIPLSWSYSKSYPVCGESVALVADNQLQLFQLSTNSFMSTTKINLEQTPKRVIYDKLLNYIVAITTTSEGNARKNYIKLLDPFTGQPLTDNHIITTSNHNENFSTNTVLSAAEWLIENNGKLYTYLCIGLGHTKPMLHSFKTKVTKSFIDRGTLLVFRLKLKRKATTRSSTTTGNYLMKRVWSQELLQGGVYSLCPYAAGLLCSAGKTLHLYRLDLEKGSLYEVAVKTLPYIITSIYEDNGRICVTSHRGSISFYYYDAETNKLKMLKSDVVPRSIHHSLMITQRLALGVSQSGGVIGLYDNPSDELYERRLQTLFCFHYPDILVRPTLAALRSTVDFCNNFDKLAKQIIPWSIPPLNDNNSIVTDGKTSIAVHEYEESVLDKVRKEDLQQALMKPVVCGTVSGGLVHIYRISPLMYQALSLLQTRLLQYGPTMPLLGSTNDFENWYSRLSGEPSASIHGDVVESFLRLSWGEQCEVLHGDQNLRLRETFKILLEQDTTDVCSIEITIGILVQFIKDILESFERFI